MLTFFTSALIPLSLVVIFRFINHPCKPPILGVYQQPNKYYWPKFILLYIALNVRRLYTHLKRILSVELGKSPDGQKHVHKYDVNLEKPYYLDDYSHAVDSLFFNGVSEEGTTVICNVARRQKKICESFLYLKIKGEDLLLSPSLPDTYLEQSLNEEGEFKAHGLKITNFIPMRTWNVDYTGDMKLRNNPEKTVKVELALTWSASWKFFNYNIQMSPLCIADALAKEEWSFEYFHYLLKFQETRYEQTGIIKGTVKIDGKVHELILPCTRSHSFGNNRDWRNLHRYVYHFIFLENGDSIAVGSFSKPILSSNITMGYICRKKDQSITAVQGTDFQLYQHGENEMLPKNYAFTYYGGGKSYVVEVKIQDEDIFYMGKNREAKFYQRWCSFEVNGIKGWGSVEWLYNNVQNSVNKPLGSQA